MMSREFWNSQAAVVRPGGGALAVSVAIGTLHEMVDHLLSWPIDLRKSLRVESEALDHPLGPAEAEALRRREDFPLVC